MTLPNSMFDRIEPRRTVFERIDAHLTWGNLLMGSLCVSVGCLLGIALILFWAGAIS